MIDAWSDRTPVPQEFKREPINGFDALLDVIRRQGRELKESTSNLLGSAGIRLKPGRMIVEQSLDVVGDLTATGNTVIGGTLSLPAGIIDNDALTNPLTTANGWSDADGFGLSTTNTTICTFTRIVPEGYTEALVDVSGVIFALNPTTSVDYLYTRVWIDSPVANHWSREILSMMGPNNGSASLAVGRKPRLTGLTAGQAITVRLTARTAFASMSAPANGATVEALLIFAR